MLGTPIHDENAVAVNNTAARLQSLGHTLVECDYRLDFEEFSQNINVIWCAFAAQFVEQM